MMLEWFVHVKTSVVAENFPGVHEEHAASSFALPGENPMPGGHGAAECFWQEEVPYVAENEPEEHGVHEASSAVAEPGVKLFPGGHAVIEWARHVELAMM